MVYWSLAVLFRDLALQPNDKEGLMRLCHSTVLAVLAVVALAAPGFAANHFVDITLTSFNPPILNINSGDTVFWTNNSFLEHTVTSGNSCSPSGLFNSGLLAPDAEFSRTFTATGSFNYFCVIHCFSNMRGTVIVDAPIPVAPKTWGAIKALYAAALR